MLRIFIHCIVPLLIGAGLYVFCKHDPTFIGSLVKKQFALNVDFDVNSNFIRFHAADMLWAYSFCSCLLISTKYSNKIIAAISLFFVSFYEIISSIFFNQTFDWKDIAFMSIAVFLSVKMIKREK